MSKFRVLLIYSLALYFLLSKQEVSLRTPPVKAHYKDLVQLSKRKIEPYWSFT